MRRLFAVLALTPFFCTSGSAQSFKPVEEAAFDGVPITRAMATLSVLGRWNIGDTGSLKIFSIYGSTRCAERDNDPDNCRNARVYVSTHSGVTDALFRGPNGMDWRLPRNEKLKSRGPGDYFIRLCGYQSLPSSYHAEVADYVLHIREYQTKLGRPNFEVAYEKKNLRTGEALDGVGNGCSSYVPLAMPPKLTK
jgi:hypothetical protein